MAAPVYNGLPYYNGSTWDMVWLGDGVNSLWDQSVPGYAYLSHAYGTVQRNSTMDTDPLTWQCIRNFGGCLGCSLGCRPDNQTHPLAPVVLDVHDQNTMYSASYRVWRNTDPRNGDTWTPISRRGPGATRSSSSRAAE